MEMIQDKGGGQGHNEHIPVFFFILNGIRSLTRAIDM